MGAKTAVVYAWMVALGVAACGGDHASADEPVTLEARLDGTSMDDTPWPSDVFLENGHYALRALPLDGQAEPVASLAATLSELDGAPSYTSVFFPVTPGAPVTTGTVDGRALYLDLDDANARPLETKLFFREQTRDLVALAPSGVLTQGHRYACVVESPRVRPSAAMKEALEGRGTHGALYAPLLPRLPPNTKPSAATVFSVSRATAMAEKMRDVAAAFPAPKITITRTFSHGAELDDLLGKPTTTRPGLGDPAGVVHDALDRVVLGTFEAPSFLHASPPKLGRVEVDPASGLPKVKGTQSIPFMLALPRKPEGGWPASGVPVMIFQHGLNAGRAQVATVANDYARAGYATIGIDALGHGERAMHVKDERHEFTGAPGPDGLADNEIFGAAITVFDLDGDASQGIGPFDGRVVRDNFRQAVVDLTVLVRLLRTAGIGGAIDDGLVLDTSKLVYTSESFGSILGAGALAITEGLDAAVLSVGGGGIFLTTLPRSPLFTGFVTPLLRVAFDGSIDTSDPIALPPDAQRSLALLQAAIMPGDPLSFAPLLAERKKNLLMLMARSDELIPNESGELLASAAQATFVSLPDRSAPPRFASFPTTGAPASSSIALVQLSPALHTMFTSFRGERRYNANMPPIEALSSPEMVDNPIELVHAMTIRYADSHRAGAAAMVTMP